ncbi:MAG: hypothetical protein WB676_32945 [Bryobacteraceae bacterium]
MVFSGLTSNKVAIGRVLPVFLAILFVGGSDQTLFAGYPTLDAHARCANGNARSKRAFYGDARAALCLLPALLRGSYHAGSSSATPFALPLHRHQPALPIYYQVLRNTRQQHLETVCLFNLRQRPPPSV